MHPRVRQLATHAVIFAGVPDPLTVARTPAIIVGSAGVTGAVESFIVQPFRASVPAVTALLKSFEYRSD